MGCQKTNVTVPDRNGAKRRNLPATGADVEVHLVWRKKNRTGKKKRKRSLKNIIARSLQMPKKHILPSLVVPVCFFLFVFQGAL